MQRALSAAQAEWVHSILAGMSLADRIGQLMCPMDREETPDEYKRLLERVPVGSIYVTPRNADKFASTVESIHAASATPAMICADFEAGAGLMIRGGTTWFPYPMTLGATDDVDLARQMGRATAREARAFGCHWSLSPLVDLNRNFRNPIVNVRGLGDDADRAAPLAAALIEGLQCDGLLAATAKHFPGDGEDDRDQHLCTTVNPLSMDQWHSTHGKMWRAAFEAGVMAVMPGHISLPAYQGVAPLDALPATIDRRLLVDFLRGELGFDGVIVSDAKVMIGLTSRVGREELAPAFFEAGGDVLLFADWEEDLQRILRAVNTGRLSEERITESARRVLEMKARVGVHEHLYGKPASPDESEQHAASAQAVADRGTIVVRNDDLIGKPLAAGAKVLTVSITRPDRNEHQMSHLETVDAELRARGVVVDHLTNPKHSELIDRAHTYDRVFLNFVILPHTNIGTIRMVGELTMPLWRAFWSDSPNVVCTTFGSPYTLYEQPHLPNMIATFSHCDASQRAAVKLWLGEMQPMGHSPVAMPVT